MIKAIIFDVDGVLLNSFEANLKFFQDLMIKAGYRPPTREEYPTYFHLTMLDAIKALTKSTSEEEIKRIWTMGRNREVKYDTDLLSLPEGIEEVLKNLSEKYSLGIATSRVRTSIFESSKLGKLEKYFRAAVSYDDTIKHKPDPEPLLLAAQKLEAKPDECIYIGDVANDITAARAAGMKAVIYSKNQRVEADACTPSFTELPELITSLSNQ